MAAAEASAGKGESLRLTTEKISDGGIVCIRFKGMINESFDGGRLANSIRAEKLILDLGDVSKISSFGIREWTNFIKGVERLVGEIYLIECSPKVIDQMKMVAGFAGRARVYSFYGPYRCDYCDLDRNVLFRSDRDGTEIRSLRPHEELCPSCGREQYFDEEPAEFFQVIASQPAFQLSTDVADFLSSKLNYGVSANERHLQIDKWVEGRHTYMRFNGNLDGSFPSEKVAEGLEGVVVLDIGGVAGIDIAGAAEWRNFINLARGGAEVIYILETPPAAFERFAKVEDLGDKVVSLSLLYSCRTCATTTSELIDVDEHHDILKFATPPERKCSTCKQPTLCGASEMLLTRLRSLQRPNVDAKLRAFIKAAKERKPERNEVVGEPSAPSVRGVRFLMGATALAVTVAAVALGLNYYQNRGIKSSLANSELRGSQTPRKPSLAEQRPSWITADTPGFSTCSEAAGVLTCVGISAFADSLELGHEDAKNAALEEMAYAVALKISEPRFSDEILPAFAEPRGKLLREFDQLAGTPGSPKYKELLDVLRSARARAAQALQKTASGLVPAQQSSWYWEEFKKDDGKASEFLVFARYELNLDALDALSARYADPVKAQDGQVVTSFPCMAWTYSDFEGGVTVLATSEALKAAGAEARSVIAAVGTTPVVTAEDFARHSGTGVLKILGHPQQVP